jgi:hypothetical protein
VIYDKNVVVTAMYMNGMTLDEIGEVLGVTKMAVHYKIYRVLDRVQMSIVKYHNRRWNRCWSCGYPVSDQRRVCMDLECRSRFVRRPRFGNHPKPSDNWEPLWWWESTHGVPIRPRGKSRRYHRLCTRMERYIFAMKMGRLPTIREWLLLRDGDPYNVEESNILVLTPEDAHSYWRGGRVELVTLAGLLPPSGY